MFNVFVCDLCGCEEEFSFSDLYAAVDCFCNFVKYEEIKYVYLFSEDALLGGFVYGSSK